MTKVVEVCGQKRLAEYRGLDSNSQPIWLLVTDAPKTRRAKRYIPYRGSHRFGLMPYGPEGTIVWTTENSLLGHLAAAQLRSKL